MMIEPRPTIRDISLRAAPLEPIPLAPLSAAPLVSIVVPSFNQGRYLRATIDSILGQDYRPVEIIVQDGGSTDDSVSVLQSYGERPELWWVSQRDRGVVDAVNQGFSRARGEIIAIQSSDDCYLPGTLSRIVREFQQAPNSGLVYGSTVKIDEHGEELSRTPVGQYSLKNLFLIRTWIPQCSAFFRREMLDTLGGWDERIPYSPDTDLWYRMAMRTEVRWLDEFLSQRRMHGEQRDTQAAKIVRDYTQMIDQSSDLPQLPGDLYAAAQAGKHLIRLRYNPTGSDWYAAHQLWQAGNWHPEARNLREVFRLAVTLPIRRQLSRLKRCLIGPPNSNRSPAVRPRGLQG